MSQRAECSLEVVDHGSSSPFECRHLDGFSLDMPGQPMYGQVEGAAGDEQTVRLPRTSYLNERMVAVLVKRGLVEVAWIDAIGEFEFAGSEPTDYTDLSTWHEPPIPGDALEAFLRVTGLYVTTDKLRPSQVLRVMLPDDGQSAVYMAVEGEGDSGPASWNG